VYLTGDERGNRAGSGTWHLLRADPRHRFLFVQIQTYGEARGSNVVLIMQHLTRRRLQASEINRG